MDLAELKFVVNTEDLERAAKEVAKLGTEVSKLNKPMQDLSKESAKTNKELPKTEEAATKAAKAAEKLGKAQDAATESSKTHMSILEKQQSITSYMSEGLSKGMATIMSYGKAAGLAANDLKLLLDTLQTQKKFSGDPFDKSLSGVTSLKNELGILKEVQRLYGAGVELTSKQVRELASDKERLIVKLKEEGASLSTMKSELRNLKSEYVNLATSINKFSDAEAQMIKQQKDAAKATAYLADADARLAAALDVSNSKLDKASSDALVKYGKALQQTGMSSDEAAAKLAKAKTQFDAIADKKQADRLQYLARAISVQMGDVGISLASGMNPLLVMIQQGDQIRGAIQQAGASGKELEKAMGNAAVQIASSFKDTGIAIGGFFVNAVKSASSALLGLPVELTKAAFLSMFASADVSAQAFERLKLAAISFSKVGVVVLITALVTLGKVMYDSLLAERELSVALATTGSKMQMNRAQAIEYAKSMAEAGKQGSQYVNVITEMAKAGYSAKDNFKLVANSAIDMEKYTGKSIAETVKAFKALAEDPVEGIAKLAKEYANVSPAVVKLVNELARQGDIAKASAVATKEMARVNAEAVKAIAADAGYLERVWLDVIENIGKGWQKLKTWVLGWGTEDTLAAQLAAKQKQLAGFNPSDNRQLVTAEKLKIEAEIQGLKDKIKLQKDAQALQTAADLKTKGEVEWQALLNKHLSKESEIKKGLAEIERVGLQAGKDRVDIERMKAEYLAKQNPKTDKFAQALETANKFYQGQAGAVEELTKSQIALNKVKESDEYRGFTADQKKQIDTIYEQASANEKLVKSEKDKVAQMAAIEGLTSKASNFNKEYYTTLKQLDNAYIDGNISLEKYIELLNLLYKTTPEAKRRLAVETENAKVMAGLGIDRAAVAAQYGGDFKTADQKAAIKNLSDYKKKVADADAQYAKQVSDAGINITTNETAMYKAQADEKKRLAQEVLDREQYLLSDGYKRQQAYATAFEDLFKGMGDAIIDFALTGKTSFGDLTKSILTNLLKMEMQMQMSSMYKGLGGIGGIIGAMSGNGLNVSTASTYGTNVGSQQTSMLAAQEAGMVPFASGGTFTNSIVDSPTMFKFAKGTGLMGEAGPEAIMPLRRGADGSLGVVAGGGSSSNVEVVVNNNSTATASAKETTDSRGNRRIEVTIGDIVASEVNRKGSGINQTIMSNTGARNQIVRR